MQRSAWRKGRQFYLAVRNMEQLGHGPWLQHMLDLPPSSDALVSQRNPTALSRCRHLRRQICGWGGGIALRATTYKDFGDVVGGREGEEDGGAVHRVCHLDAVGDVREESLCLSFDVVDHG